MPGVDVGPREFGLANLRAHRSGGDGEDGLG
jgi:hypothetical protein